MKKKKKSEPKSPEACWNCADDPDGKLKQMFVDIVQTRRIKQDQTPLADQFFSSLTASRVRVSKSVPTCPKS